MWITFNVDHSIRSIVSGILARKMIRSGDRHWDAAEVEIFHSSEVTKVANLFHWIGVVVLGVMRLCGTMTGAESWQFPLCRGGEVERFWQSLGRWYRYKELKPIPKFQVSALALNFRWTSLESLRRNTEQYSNMFKFKSLACSPNRDRFKLQSCGIFHPA